MNETDTDLVTFVPLVKIAEIEILGIRYDLAKNGHYAICSIGTDAYGKPIATQVTLPSTSDHIQALLDLLGDAMSRLQVHRDSRLDKGKSNREE